MKNAYSLLFLLVFLLVTYTTAYSQWTSNTSLNTPICVATGAQRDPKIESDNMGGAFIAWKDYRTGVPDIYVQHVDSNGIPLWTVNGLGVCIEAADQSTPSMISDGAGGVIITWSDWRSGIERDIYAQRINASGTILWPTDGAVVTTQTEREHNEKIISDGAGGCIITFEKQSSSTFLWDIWAQRLNSNGVTQWPAGGVPVAINGSNKRNPKIQMDHTGGAYITWQDLRNGVEYDIYAQHLTSAGARLWTDNALAVCAATNDQTNPKIDPDIIHGGVYIAWADQRNGIDNDIYCQLIDSTGNAVWISNGISVCSAANGQSAVDILSNSNVTGIILTWKDDRSGNTDIYAQRLNVLGVPQWTPNGIPVQSNTYPQLNPNISGDGVGGAIICWQDSSALSQWDIRAQRISATGVKLWNSNGAMVANASADQVGPKNCSDDYEGTIVVWEDFRTGVRDIYAQHIYWDGFQVSIENPSEQNTFAVYPNPTSDLIFFDRDDITNIKIFDMNGKLLLQSNLTNQMISVSSLVSGMYIIECATSKGKINSRFIKQ